MYGFIIRYKKNHAFAWLFKWLPTARLPIKFLTEFFCRPGSRFLPCAPGVLTRTNKNIAPPFSPHRRQSSLPAPGFNKKPRKSEAFKFALGGIRGMFDFLYSKDKKNNPFHYTAFPLWFIPVPVHQFNLFIFLLHFLLHFRELLDGSG